LDHYTVLAARAVDPTQLRANNTSPCDAENLLAGAFVVAARAQDVIWRGHQNYRGTNEIVSFSRGFDTRKLGRHQISTCYFQIRAQFRPRRVPDAGCDLRLAIHETVKIGRIEYQQARGLKRDSGRGTPRLPQGSNFAEEIACTEMDMLVTQPDLHLAVYDQIH
jgi:hypothetical protein